MDVAERRNQNRLLSRQLLPYFLVIPALIFYALFWLRPVMQQFIDSFTNAAGQFTLDNYRLVFNDPDFGIAFANTAIIVVISVVLEFFLALFLALLINRNFRGSSIFLFLVYPHGITCSCGSCHVENGINHKWLVKQLVNVYRLP